MDIRRICILGGSGFIGRHLVPKLSALGVETRVISRHPQRHRELSLNPGCTVVKANIFDKQELLAVFEGCDGVVNLVGILNERRKNDFRRVHVELIDLVSSCARQSGVRRLLHMSALNANAGSGSSFYLRTKGEGENRAHTGGKPDIAVTSFKPSVIFGPDDSFINRFAGLIKIPGPLPLACPNARFAPVYVEDVCQAMANSLNNRHSFGQRYELCGPDTYTLRELVKYIGLHSGRKKWIIGMSDSLSKLQASVLEKLPGKVFTTDNYLSMQKDSVCQDEKFNLQALGVTPTSLDSVVPAFLQSHSERSRYMSLRRVPPGNG